MHKNHLFWMTKCIFFIPMIHPLSLITSKITSQILVYHKNPFFHQTCVSFVKSEYSYNEVPKQTCLVIKYLNTSQQWWFRLIFSDCLFYITSQTLARFLNTEPVIKRNTPALFNFSHYKALLWFWIQTLLCNIEWKRFSICLVMPAINGFLQLIFDSIWHPYSV